ncbi:MAG: hypothetical protein K6G68_08765 [Oscillospiraceae bacterium]|nr:hypothetical protein [Oscillospiraceae bacterium]
MIKEDTVSIDHSRELDNLYTLARRAKQEGNSENAEKYYSQIVELSPNDPEAYFYSVYYQVSNCKIGEIGSAATRLKAVFNSTVQILKDNGIISNGNTDELVPFGNAVIDLAHNLSENAYNHYINNVHVSGIREETDIWISKCVNAVCAVGDAFYNLNDKKNAATCYKKADSVFIGQGRFRIDSLAINRIQEVEPDYEHINNTTNSGCLTVIAIIMGVAITCIGLGSMISF